MSTRMRNTITHNMITEPNFASGTKTQRKIKNRFKTVSQKWRVCETFYGNFLCFLYSMLEDVLQKGSAPFLSYFLSLSVLGSQLIF